MSFRPARRLGTDAVDLDVHAAAAYAAVGRTHAAEAALAEAFSATPYTFPELRPVAMQLAERLGVAVPPEWGG